MADAAVDFSEGSLTVLACALRMRVWVSAAFALAAGGSVGAAVIEGEIAFPSHEVPALKAYVCDVDTARIRTVQIPADAGRFSIDVPPGRYTVFLAPNEPGAPNIYGAYTEYSQCAARSAEGGSAPVCDDHALVAVSVGAKSARLSVRIDDWYLSDDIADELDHLRGLESAAAAEPLGAPKFSEYHVAAAPLPVPKLDFADTAWTAQERSRVQQSLAGGPNFAAQSTLALLPCGAGCERIVLVDWRSGRIVLPEPPGDLQGTLPCRADEAVQFRRDSLLLEVTRPRPGGVVTQYYLWRAENATFALAGEYTRDAAQFCGALPPRNEFMR
jgi:hypothetical protein